MIYLDHNATTPLDPRVAEAMQKCWRDYPANPASQHQAGQRARRRLEAARSFVAQTLGVDTSGMDADHVVFTSGGTESNNMALLGLAGKSPGKVVISSIEHPSVVGAAETLMQRGFEVVRLAVDSQGVAKADHLRDVLEEGDGKLVSVMLGNNETGALQPVKELAAIARQFGALFHTDATQVVGKLPVDFGDLAVDALTATAHKFHGPAGVGLLLVRSAAEMTPLLAGGFQQLGLRPGSESVALAAGFQQALEIFASEGAERAERMARLRDRLEGRILQGAANVVINGAGAARLPHTTNLAPIGVDRQAALLALDMAGVACSTGSACASGSSEPSPTLLAMGCSDEVVASSLRISLGAFTTEEEVEDAADRIVRTIEQLRR